MEERDPPRTSCAPSHGCEDIAAVRTELEQAPEGEPAREQAAAVTNMLAANAAAELERKLNRRRMRGVLAAAGLDPWNVAVIEHVMEAGQLSLTGLYRIILRLDNQGLPRHLVDEELAVLGYTDKADQPAIRDRHDDVLADWQGLVDDREGQAVLRVIDIGKTTAQTPDAGVLRVPEDLCPTVGEQVYVVDPKRPSRRRKGTVGRHIEGYAEIWI